MAWSWYLNIDPISLSMAYKSCDKMTEMNFLHGVLDLDGSEGIPDDVDEEGTKQSHVP